jgi:pimeloyl-ACP methyl ester carboxylesterase
MSSDVIAAQLANGQLAAGQLVIGRTVVTYDRRGYSRRRLDDPSQPASIAVHAGDVRRVIEDFGSGPASVFATSASALIGLTRGRSLAGANDRPEVRRGDIELFIRRDVSAVADYHLDLDRLSAATDRIIVAASADGREFYPHRCAEALAAAGHTRLIEFPGNHAAMTTHPVKFAARLTPLLADPVTR